MSVPMLHTQYGEILTSSHSYVNPVQVVPSATPFRTSVMGIDVNFIER